MQTIILVLGGIFWILTYIIIISKGFKDKTYGMPMVALAANISWEFIFSFVLPHSAPQRFINYLWFVLDVVIVIQFLKYSKNEFLNLTSLKLYSIFILMIVTAFGIIMFGSIMLGDITGVYSAFGQNLLMSILFIIMFFKRKNFRGQSFSIAIFKMLGTGFTSVHFYFYEPVTQTSFVLPFLFASIFFFDLLYSFLIIRKYRENHISLLKI